MQAELQVLIITAVTIACLHTATGPDHYIPFIALSKSRGWSLSRTLFWTITCGLGHIASSVALGLGGAALGWSLSKISWAENVRGGLAGWVLLLFGLVYAAWGLYRAKKNTAHKHFDMDAEGSIYVFEHRHRQVVLPSERHKVTPWIMFLIFVLGPCQPMIPLLYFPAAQNSISGMLVLISVYSVCTLLTMVTLVLMGYFSFSFFKTAKLEKHIHSLAGLTLFVCGAGMVFLDW